MKALFSFLAVIVLSLVAIVGVNLANLQVLFGIIIPYLAFAIFVGGFIYRIIKWGRSPVPFRIPTTIEQKNLHSHSYDYTESARWILNFILFDPRE